MTVCWVEQPFHEICARDVLRKDACRHKERVVFDEARDGIACTRPDAGVWTVRRAPVVEWHLDLPRRVDCIEDPYAVSADGAIDDRRVAARDLDPRAQIRTDRHVVEDMVSVRDP